MKISPPKRPLRFLRWFCREDFLEEIEGDLTEVFQKQYESSPRKAEWKFAWSVVKYFRPEFIKSFKTAYPNNLTAMFQHNFLMSYRNFLRNKSSFIVNLISLSTGLACTILIYLWVSDELSMDRFHEHESRLFRVRENRLSADGIRTSPSASGLLGESLTAEMPEVEAAINVSSIESYTLSVGEKNIKADGHYAGKYFFRMFSYPLIHGQESQVLTDKHSIVISRELAMKLFNTDNVIGKSIVFDHDVTYAISGVFEKANHASESFDFVGSFEKYKEGREYLQHWGNTATYAFVLLNAGADVIAFNAKIADYIKLKTNNEIKHRTPFLTRYADEYLHGKYENGVQSGGRITYVKLFSIIAIFTLVIACINFMNLSTAKASKRVKEVGIKKAVGAGRGMLILQYLTESVLISFLSLLAAALLVYVLLPQFNEITGKHLFFPLNLTVIASAAGIIVLVGLLAGSYPALYLSGFKPVAVLKGKLNASLGEQWIRKGLVVFQFALTSVFIVSVWVVYQQMEFIQSKDLGYNKDNLIYFPLVGELQKTINQESFITEIEKIPGVMHASSVSHDMTGHSRGTYRVNWEGKDPNDRTEFEVFTVNYGALEMLEIEIVEGRSFSKSHSNDPTKIIFNEAAIKFMGLNNPIGKMVKLDTAREIIGVVKNFHFQSLHENVKPAFFLVNPNDTYLFMTKFSAVKQKEALTNIEGLYKKFNPGFPFDFQFLDQEYQAQYHAEQRVAVLSKYFAGLGILISCLGLFGLAAFTAEKRTHEIAIRKVLGSSEMGIFYLLTSDFTKIVITAILVSLPLSYLLAKQWLSCFAYKIDLHWWYFVGAGLLTLFIAWLTVGMQTFKAALMNPVESLKSE